MPVGDYFQEYGPVRRRREQASPDTQDDQPPRTRRPREPDRPPRRTPRRSRPQRTITPALLKKLLVWGLLLGAVLLLVLPYAVSLVYAGRAMPGVTVEQLPVANLNQQAISTMVAARHTRFEREPVTLTFEAHTWKPALADLGATFSPDDVAARALVVGRQGGPLRRWSDLWTLWQNGLDVVPHVVVDWQQLQTYLIDLSADIESPPRDAMIGFSRGQVVGTAGVNGTQVLVDESAQALVLALQTLAPQDVVLRTRVLTPVITDAALHRAQEHAEVLLSSTLVFTHGQDVWQWNREELTRLFRIEPVERQLTVTLDHEKLTRAVEQLAQLIDSGSVEPRLRFAGGTLQVVEPGREGWRLIQDEAVQVISTTLHQSRPTTQTTVALPIETLSPQITEATIGDLGITELVGEGLSSFAGSADYRITNIKAGSARFDGVLIPPGDVFSFNTQLGDVDAEHGFVEGYAVIGNRTQLEWGGGVCQNSTTVFRAAFWAGLPIVERHAHPFYISWYDRYAYGPYGDGPGMDATIFTGVNDLRFANDTGHWLLMHSTVDEVNQVLTVQLYGTRPERTVGFEGPHISNEVSPPSTPIYVDDPTRPAGSLYQSDVARSGRDIVVYRTIERPGQPLEREAFFTRFKPWPNVYVRGTGQ